MIVSSVRCGWELSVCRCGGSWIVSHEGNVWRMCKRHAVAHGKILRRERDAVRAFLLAVGVSDLAVFGDDPFGAVAATGAFDGDYRRCRFSRVYNSRRWAGVFDGCSDAGDIVDTCRLVLERAGDL